MSALGDRDLEIDVLRGALGIAQAKLSAVELLAEEFISLGSSDVAYHYDSLGRLILARMAEAVAS